MKIILLCIIMILTGCVKYKPNVILPADTASSFESRTLDSPGLKEFLENNLKREVRPWPPERWDFEMLTLAALYYHPDLDVSRAKWGVAEAGAKTAGARPNPGVSFTPEFNADSPGGVSPWTLGLSLNIPLETANKRGYRTAEAGHLSEAARLNIAGTAWQVRSRLREKLLNLFIAERTEQILQRRLAIQEEMVNALDGRLKAGEASQPEVTAGRISLEEARHALLKTQAGKAQSLQFFASGMGLTASALKGVDIVFPFTDIPPDLPPPELQNQALLNRTDILSALEGYKASEAALRLEIAKQYPDIRLGPGYSWDQGDNKWALGFSMTLPVFNWNEGPIAEAEARRKEAEAGFKALQIRVIGDLSVAVSGYQAAMEKFKAADNLLASGRRRLREAEALFDAGEADRLFLLGARLEVEFLEQSRLEGLSDAQEFSGLLEDALQHPIEGNVEGK